jgi:hypothetical protein
MSRRIMTRMPRYFGRQLRMDRICFMPVVRPLIVLMMTGLALSAYTPAGRNAAAARMLDHPQDPADPPCQRRDRRSSR